MRLLANLLPVIAVSCGQMNYIEPELAVLTGEFIADCHKHNNSKCLTRFDAGISIGIAEQNSLNQGVTRIGGTCTAHKDNRLQIRKVLIDKEYVDQGGLLLKALLYHELGHCLLACGHNDSSKIMATNLNVPATEEELNVAITALFHGCN